MNILFINIFCSIYISEILRVCVFRTVRIRLLSPNVCMCMRVFVYVCVCFRMYACVCECMRV